MSNTKTVMIPVSMDIKVKKYKNHTPNQKDILVDHFKKSQEKIDVKKMNETRTELEKLSEDILLDDIDDFVHKNSTVLNYRLKEKLHIGISQFELKNLVLFKCIETMKDEEYKYRWTPSIAEKGKQEKDIDMTPFLLLGMSELMSVFANYSNLYRNAINNELIENEGEDFEEIVDKKFKFNSEDWLSNEWTPLFGEFRRFTLTPLDTTTDKYLRTLLFYYLYNKKRFYDIFLKILKNVSMLFEPFMDPKCKLAFQPDCFTFDITSLHFHRIATPLYFTRVRRYFKKENSEITLNDGTIRVLTNVKRFSCMLVFQLSAALYNAYGIPWKPDETMLSTKSKYAYEFQDIECGYIYQKIMNESLGNDAIGKYLRKGIIQKNLKNKFFNKAYGFYITKDEKVEAELNNSDSKLLHEEASIDKQLFCRRFNVTEDNIPKWDPLYNMHYVKFDWNDDPFTFIDSVSASYYAEEQNKARKKEASKVANMQNRIDLLEENCKTLNQRLKAFESEGNNNEKYLEEIQSLQKTISDLSFQLENQKSYSERIAAERDEQRRELDVYHILDEEDIPEEVPSIDSSISIEEKITFVRQYSVLIVGGIVEMKTRLENMGMNNISQFCQCNQKYDITAKPDFVFLCTEFMSHSLLGSVKSKNLVPRDKYIVFNGTNLELAIDMMYQFIKKWLAKQEDTKNV